MLYNSKEILRNTYDRCCIFALPLYFLELFAFTFYLSPFACLRCWICLMRLSTFVLYAWCVELDDVSLPVFFLCFSERL